VLGEVSRRRRHLVEEVRRLPFDRNLRIDQKVFKRLLVLLNAGTEIVARLGHAKRLSSTVDAGGAEVGLIPLGWRARG
jgi:hypothetical protein